MSGGKWDDLAVRLAVGIILAIVGIWSIWMGGLFLNLVLAIAGAAMTWELARMLAPHRGPLALQLAALSGGALFAAFYFPPYVGVALLLATPLVGLNWLVERRIVYAGFAAAILISAFGLSQLRNDFGLVWMLWLVLIVISTDILGYFAGRQLGGPKFWPRISPKKTWSGTAAGWAGAAILGVIFMFVTGSGAQIVLISVAMSLASQLGDIAESALKRWCGVKDSSGLLPGHGGVLDRFDGILGASLFLIMVQGLIAFPPVPY